jgi:hypothetical protein
MELHNHLYKATNGFVNNKRVRIEDGGERISLCYVQERKKTYDDGQKIIVEGKTTGQDPVRAVTNIEARGNDTVVKVLR